MIVGAQPNHLHVLPGKSQLGQAHEWIFKGDLLLLLESIEVKHCFSLLNVSQGVRMYAVAPVHELLVSNLR